jgi:hypothetical protein
MSPEYCPRTYDASARVDARDGHDHHNLITVLHTATKRHRIVTSDLIELCLKTHIDQTDRASTRAASSLRNSNLSSQQQHHAAPS